MEVKVLMVDDHPPIIEGYKSILSFNTYGYKLSTTAAYSCEAAFDAIVNSNTTFDIVFLDLTLPPYLEKGINSGEDLIPIVRKFQPDAKVIVLTSHSESIVLFKLLNEQKPDGLLVKSDFQADELLIAFHTIVQGETYYSQTIIRHQKNWEEKNKVMDNYNRQILLLLSQGIQTKSLPDLLHLSKSAIDKRKAIIKQIFGIDKGTDEDILREARKQGLI
ncbi:response regulator [Flavobacterium sp. 25HG05S-40]|uniref:response regulator n=1 Tax=Flavobacterium sp. 25HG05S-40 TaxID=3458682 RepID=UPI00404468E0